MRPYHSRQTRLARNLPVAAQCKCSRKAVAAQRHYSRTDKEQMPYRSPNNAVGKNIVKCLEPRDRLVWRKAINRSENSCLGIPIALPFQPGQQTPDASVIRRNRHSTPLPTDPAVPATAADHRPHPPDHRSSAVGINIVEMLMQTPGQNTVATEKFSYEILPAAHSKRALPVGKAL